MAEYDRNKSVPTAYTSNTMKWKRVSKATLFEKLRFHSFNFEIAQNLLNMASFIDLLKIYGNELKIKDCSA